MKKLKKSWWILLIASVAAAFLLEIIQINTQPATVTYTASEELQQQEKDLFPDQMLLAAGYSVEPDGIRPDEPDPQMYFSTEGAGEVSWVYFHFNAPLESDLRIQVFYPGENGYSEIDSTVSISPAGVSFWPVVIPAAEYDQLRIDIDGTKGVLIPLQSIGTGTAAPVSTKIQPGIHWRRIPMVAVMLFAVLCWIVWVDVTDRLVKAVRAAVRTIRENGRKSVLNALAFPAGIGLGIFLFWLFCTVIGGKPMTAPRAVLAGFAGFFVTSMLVFRKTLKTQPEYFFLILVVSIGFLYCNYVPHTGLNSWDEDVHYAWALRSSYVDSVTMTPQDHLTITRTVPASYDLNGGVQAVHNIQDQLYHNGATESRGSFNITAIPEVFNGIGLFLGRAFGMPYHMIHFMGRFTGLLAYALLGFLAIRKLKSGKMIAATVLLIPTAVFLASSYNYDSYLTGFTALGFCYYLAQWQDRQAKLTLKDTVIMIGSIAFGCVIKPLYIPLLWIVLLLPKDKFPDAKTRRWFVWSVIGASVLVIFSYFIPSLLFGKVSGVVGDSRGGENVSSAGQIRYMLAHPAESIHLIWDYLINAYFNLSRVGELMTHFPYFGIMPNQYLYLALLAVVAFTDKNEYDRELVHHPWIHLWPVIVSLGVTVLVIVSMYLAFTPVGADFIGGAQFRYMMPMILPVLLHIGSGLMENKMDRGWYNALVLSATAFVGFATVYNAYVGRYY